MIETEASFQTWVIELAQHRGWLVAHFRAAQTSKGWVTPVAGDATGFPDLVLVHPGFKRVLFRELKADRGKLSMMQDAWQSWLERAGADVGVWRPRDRPEIEAALSS